MFCNQCGKQVGEQQQYCGICGDYLKKEVPSIQFNETKFNFCRSCGTEITGRYCGNCGESSVQTEGKVRTLGGKIEIKKEFKNTALGKSNIWSMNLANPPKEEILKWVKQGLIFAAIVAVIGILISFLGGIWLKDKILTETGYNYYYDDFNSSLKNVYGIVINGAGFVFAYLFGGKLAWKLSLGRDISGDLLVTVPFMGVIITTLIIMASEKIRATLSGQKLTVLGTAILSVVNAVVIALGSTLFGKTIRLSSRELSQIQLSQMGYGDYNNFDMVKFGTYIHKFSTFFIVLIMTFIVLNWIIKREGAKGQLMMSIIKKVTYAIVGFSFLVALGVVIKMFVEAGSMPEGNEYLMTLLIVIYLMGVVMTALVTGQFKLMELVLDSESILKLKAGWFNLYYNCYGMEDKVEHFMRWWMLIGVLIVVIMILTAAYQFFKGRNLEMKAAFQEAGLLSLVLGGVFSLLVRIAAISMEVRLRCNDSYYREMLDMNRNKYSLIMKSGSTSVIDTWFTVTVITLVLFMLMYWLMTRKLPVVDMIMEYMNFKLVWAVIIVFCIALTVKFDVYEIDNISTSFFEDGIESFADEIEKITSNLF